MILKKHKSLLFFIVLLVIMNVLGPLLIMGMGNLIEFTFYQKNMIWLFSVPLIGILAIITTVKIFKIDLNFKLDKVNSMIIYYSILLVMLAFVFQIVLDRTFIDGLINNNVRALKFNLNLETGLFENTYLILSVLIAPLLEELLYRRIMFKELLKQYGVTYGLILTSFLFALNHQSIEGFVAYFFIGIVYTYLYYLTRSLWLNVLIHCVFNLLASVTLIKVYSSADMGYFLWLFIYLICGFGVFLTFKKIHQLSFKKSKV